MIGLPLFPFWLVNKIFVEKEKMELPMSIVVSTAKLTVFFKMIPPWTQRKTIKVQKYQSMVTVPKKAPLWFGVYMASDVDNDDVTHIVPHTAERPSLMWCVCGFWLLLEQKCTLRPLSTLQGPHILNLWILEGLLISLANSLGLKIIWHIAKRYCRDELINGQDILFFSPQP